MNGPPASLSNLPLELKERIFIYCIANRSPELMFTCKQLHNEMQPYLRKNFTLNLQITPSVQQSKIWIVLEPDQLWGSAQNSIDVSTSHLRAVNNPLAGMPLHDFKNLCIFVDAPDPDDPGQTIRMHKEISSLITILSPSWRVPGQLPRDETDIRPRDGGLPQTLPPIEVYLRDTPSATWSSSDSWHQSLPSYADELDEDDNLLSDLLPECEDIDLDVELAIYPFMRLRNATSLRIIFHTHIHAEPRLETLLADIQQVAVSNVSFGLALGEWTRLEDEVIYIFESCHFLWLDHLLDDMRGPSAQTLRLERFYSWCHKYETHVRQSLFGIAQTGVNSNPYWGAAIKRLGDDFVFELGENFSQRWWVNRLLQYEAGERSSRHRTWLADDRTHIHMVDTGVAMFDQGWVHPDTRCGECRREIAGMSLRSIGNRGVY